MRSRYKIKEEGTYFVTSTLINWTNLFSDKRFADIIVDELKFRIKNRELQLSAYVIMPNHFHLILSSENIPVLMRSMKSYTARKIIQRLELIAESTDDAFARTTGVSRLRSDEAKIILNQFEKNKLSAKQDSKYQVWQEGYHPKLLLTDDEFGQKINYIHNNPVKKGLVKLPEEWKYSSYRNYYFDDNSILEFELPYSY